MSQEKAITDIHDYTHYNNDARGDGTWRQASKDLNGIHFDILHQCEASVIGLMMNTLCSKCACMSSIHSCLIRVWKVGA